eukprot:20680-Hanusia_phi.AAC.2
MSLRETAGAKNLPIKALQDALEQCLPSDPGGRRREEGGGEAEGHQGKKTGRARQREWESRRSAGGGGISLTHGQMGTQQMVAV